MSAYALRPVRGELFSVYHAIYQAANIDLSYDWEERIRGIRSDDPCFFLVDGETVVGGLILDGIHVHSPFTVQSLCNQIEFWSQALACIKAAGCAAELHLHRIPEQDAAALSALGAVARFSQRRMCRPTDRLAYHLKDGFTLGLPNEREKPEIIQVVYQAHADGYTAVVHGKPDLSEVEEAVNRRFQLFSQTDTLHLGAVVKWADTREIAGVCLAGIYPDSPNRFATIHQVSVLPQYQGNGLGKAMLLHSISAAHALSPVIGLQVLAGNPAEQLYQHLGFLAGPAFTELVHIP